MGQEENISQLIGPREAESWSRPIVGALAINICRDTGVNRSGSSNGKNRRESRLVGMVRVVGRTRHY